MCVPNALVRRDVLLAVGAPKRALRTESRLVFFHEFLGEDFATRPARPRSLRTRREMVAQLLQFAAPFTPAVSVRALDAKFVDASRDADVPERAHLPRGAKGTLSVDFELHLETVTAIVAATAKSLARIA